MKITSFKNQEQKLEKNFHEKINLKQKILTVSIHRRCKSIVKDAHELMNEKICSEHELHFLLQQFVLANIIDDHVHVFLPWFRVADEIDSRSFFVVAEREQMIPEVELEDEFGWMILRLQIVVRGEEKLSDRRFAAESLLDACNSMLGLDHDHDVVEGLAAKILEDWIVFDRNPEHHQEVGV